MKYLRPVLFLLTALLVRAATPAVFTNWPAGTAPAEIGRRVAENFAARPRRTGDLHGQAPIMWTAAAFLR